MKNGHYCINVTTTTPWPTLHDAPHPYLPPAMPGRCFYKPPQVSCCLLFVWGLLLYSLLKRLVCECIWQIISDLQLGFRSSIFGLSLESSFEWLLLNKHTEINQNFYYYRTWAIMSAWLYVIAVIIEWFTLCSIEIYLKLSDVDIEEHILNKSCR